MSAARRLEAARDALLTICGLLTDPTMALALAVATRGLRASAEPQSSVKHRARCAALLRAKRERNVSRDPPVSAEMSSAASRNVSLEGEGGGVFSDQENTQIPSGEVGESEGKGFALVSRNVSFSGAGVFGMEGPAFADGIRSVTGRPCRAPAHFDVTRYLVPATRHAGGLTGPPLLAWVRAKAASFARANDPAFGFSPRRFCDWLDAGEPKANDRPSGVRATRPGPADHEIQAEARSRRLQAEREEIERRIAQAEGRAS